MQFTIYPNNIATANAITYITQYTTLTSFSNANKIIPSYTKKPDIANLISATQTNPNIQITITPTTTPTSNTFQIFSEYLAHEMMELAADPTYGDYILTSNPMVDGAALFSQYEAAVSC